MKREDLLAKGYTEEQVTDLLNTFHGINTENEKLKSDLLTKAEVEAKYNAANSKLEEIQKANMTEQERLEAIKKETENNYRASKLIVNKAKAKEILAGCNIDEELIDSLINDDETKTIANATKLKNSFDSLSETISKKMKEQLSNLDVKPAPTNVPQETGIMTKEKFDSMSMMDQKTWKDTNIDKYHEFYPQQ